MAFTTIRDSFHHFIQSFDIRGEIPYSNDFPRSINSAEPTAQLFDFCQYFRTNRQHLVMVIHPSSEALNEVNMKWLADRGCTRIRPFLNNVICSFVIVVDEDSMLITLLQKIQYAANVGYSTALLHFGLRYYVGKVLHVTSGSGKTYLNRLASRWFRIVEGEDVVMQQIQQQYPGIYGGDMTASDFVTKFCQERMPCDVKRVMRAARSQCLHYAGEGCIVLSSTLGLMNVADFVLIQRNHLLWREGYDPNEELSVARRLNKPLLYMDKYLALVLSCDSRSI